MRLFQQLIATLNADELALVNAMPLRGKKKEVLKLMIAARSMPEGSLAIEIKKLAITKEHLYEITSLLLHSCYEVVCPNGNIELLDLLSIKNLPTHYKKQLRVIEKEVVGRARTEHDLEKLSTFYLTIYFQLQRFPFSLFDWKLIGKYEAMYLESIGNHDPEAVLGLEAHRIRHTLQNTQIANKRKATSIIATSYARLKEIELIAEKSHHTLLNYFTYESLGWYHQNIEKDPSLSLHYLEKLMIHSANLDTVIFPRANIRTKLQVADAYINIGRNDESITLFESVFSNATPSDHAWVFYRFSLRYIETLISVGQYKKAELLLKEKFDSQFIGEPTSVTISVASLYLILYLITAQYTKAKFYLDLSIKLNTEKNHLVYNEVRNRYLEAVYYYLIGDWAYTPDLCERALHYLRGKGLGLKDNSFGYFFKLIEASIDLHTNNKAFTPELEARYAELTLPQEALFGKLLIEIRNGKGLDSKKKKK